MLYSVIEQNIKDSLLQKIQLLIYHRFQDKISDLNIIGLPVLYISKPIIPIVNFFFEHVDCGHRPPVYNHQMLSGVSCFKMVLHVFSNNV